MAGDDQHPSDRVVAVVALLDPSDRLLMVRTRRLPDHWQPVGGGQIAQDASPFELALVELPRPGMPQR